MYNKIYKLFFIVVSLSFSLACAKDLGVYGETFGIAEENLLAVIQKKLTLMQKSGDLERKQKELAQAAEAKIRRPLPVKRLIKTVIARQWLYDPSLTVEADMKDHQGTVIAAKGTVINPLDTVSWGAPLLFLDGDDSEQVAWAQRQASLAPWVLVKGSPIEAEERHHRPIYFDQAGRLTTKFGIQQVPCRISQQGKVLLVEELNIKERANE